MLEEYAGSVPYAVELLASAAERLDGEHRTRALAELALARFRINDVAGLGECAARIQEAANHNDPEQRMLSDFTRGVAATLGDELAVGQVLLSDVIERSPWSSRGCAYCAESCQVAHRPGRNHQLRGPPGGDRRVLRVVSRRPCRGRVAA